MHIFLRKYMLPEGGLLGPKHVGEILRNNKLLFIIMCAQLDGINMSQVIISTLNLEWVCVCRLEHHWRSVKTAVNRELLRMS
jgi:hypothetical protein